MRACACTYTRSNIVYIRPEKSLSSETPSNGVQTVFKQPSKRLRLMVIRVQLDVQNGDVWFWAKIALELHWIFILDIQKMHENE